MIGPLETERLILRDWEARDHAPFAALNADPEVMEHFPGTLDRAGTEALLERIAARRDEDGFAFAAAERRADGAFLGMVGISRLRMPTVPRLDGAVEIGWRLARAAWGMGYATEAALAWRDAGFRDLGLPEIVAVAVPANHRSHAVMRRLGMTLVPGGQFAHPALPEGSPLREHLVFRIGRDAWQARGRG